MKKLTSAALAAALLASAVLTASSCGGNTPFPLFPNTTSTATAAATTTTTTATTAAATSTTEDTEDPEDDSGAEVTTAEDDPSFGDIWGETTTAAAVDPRAVDYSSPDITIEYDSGEKIVTFTDEMLAGQHDGKVVKCEGICSRRMNGCAMMQEQEDGTSRGFTWYIVDSESADDYPPEDARTEITGVVGIGDYGVRYLYVLPENVNVIGLEY